MAKAFFSFLDSSGPWARELLLPTVVDWYLEQGLVDHSKQLSDSGAVLHQQEILLSMILHLDPAVEFPHLYLAFNFKIQSMSHRLCDTAHIILEQAYYSNSSLDYQVSAKSMYELCKSELRLP